MLLRQLCYRRKTAAWPGPEGAGQAASALSTVDNIKGGETMCLWQPAPSAAVRYEYSNACLH